jgi:hypothetical protein
VQLYKPTIDIWEEWHLIDAPELQKYILPGVTNRYYLAIHSNHSFEIRVNYRSVYNGTLDVRVLRQREREAERLYLSLCVSLSVRVWYSFF